MASTSLMRTGAPTCPRRTPAAAPLASCVGLAPAPAPRRHVTSAPALPSAARHPAGPLPAPRRVRQARLTVRANAGQGDKPFGYSRKDVILIGVGIFALGYGAYYGLQAQGMDAGRAGNYVQVAVFSALTFGWVGSYLWRVGTKNMTYVRQLEAYEEAVMAKRLEEMPEAERARLVAQAEAERAAREGGGGGGGSA